MSYNRIVYLPSINYQTDFMTDQYCFSSHGVYRSDDLSEGYSFEAYPCWNLWLLSHHCSFLVWSLTIDALRKEQYSQAENYLLIYNEILTYTRVITPDAYDHEVRPIMAAFWPGFSAVWSYEFQLLKWMIKNLCKSAEHTKVHEAFKVCHINHLTTAKTLVPKGRSLLQEIKKAGKMKSESDEVLNFAYDSLFLIQRKTVSIKDLELQVIAKFKNLSKDAITLQCTAEMPYSHGLIESLEHKWLK
tara:strand:- start:3256 stop:3990 length:735 start_codon:yes stop_codon:yes gene_type:complete